MWKDIQASISDWWQNLKIGVGHVGAMLRLGFKELQTATALDSPIVQPTELGSFASALPSEIAAVRQRDGPALNTINDVNPSLADRIRAIETQPAAPSREEMEIEKE